ncbi:hypothetical protein VCHC50A1_3051, partial [Vibrio cholerae HC-50A1]|jgi:transposase-like protein
MKDSH